MFEKIKLKRGLKKRAKELEQTNVDLISASLHANFDKGSHIMLVEEEKVYADCYSLTRSELVPLEKVDLIDYWVLENARPNKKRRNLLRRP